MRIVLIRHGESIWNKENKFTGWTDVDLSNKGKEEAKVAGEKLKEINFNFDIAYVSYLKRAIKTLYIVLEQMDLLWIPVNKTWRLNERHYGALQGLNKAKTIEEFGEKQVQIWRRSYNIMPPLLDDNDKRNPKREDKYKNIKDKLPLGESLETTISRVIPYWKNEILPILKENKDILIVAHGNSLRGLIKYIENIDDRSIENLNIPTGKPLVYEFDENMNIIHKYHI